MNEESIEQMSREPAGREPFLTAGQVAKQLGVSRAWVYQHSNGKRNPRLASHKFGAGKGAMVRFKQSDIDDFVARLKRSQEPWTIQ